LDVLDKARSAFISVSQRLISSADPDSRAGNFFDSGSIRRTDLLAP